MHYFVQLLWKRIIMPSSVILAVAVFYSKCNKLNYKDYKYLQSLSDPWYSISCCNSVFPFSNSIEQNFNSFIKSSNTVRKTKNWIPIENTDDNSLILKSSPNLTNLVNNFSNTNHGNDDGDPKGIVQEPSTHHTYP